MPSSSVRRFTGPDEFGSAIRGATHEVTVTQQGNFTAQLTRIDLHNLWMQRLSADLATVGHVQLGKGRAFFMFGTHLGASEVRNGVELTMEGIARLRLDQNFYRRTTGRSAHAGMSLPLDKVAALGPVAGIDLMPPTDDLTVTPSLSALARLRRLHEAAGTLAEHVPTVLSTSEAAHGLEQSLIDAMIHCLSGGDVEEDQAAQRKHAKIMHRFQQVTEEHLDQPLYVPDLCKEIGTSQRTLEACCHEHLGMSAKHFLLLRRMHMARRALRESTRAETTVTEIATRFGFWQFGRLAVEYKTLFGESPSATPARPA